MVDGALGRLAERSLLAFSLDGQAVIAHRLVLRVVRDGLARRERLAAVCRAAAAVLDARAAALAGSLDRVAVRDVPEQVTALREAAGRLRIGGLVRSWQRMLLRLRVWAVYHLVELGDSAAQAIVVGEPLAADCERVLGPDHPDTLASRNNLANAYVAAGRTVVSSRGSAASNRSSAAPPRSRRRSSPAAWGCSLTRPSTKPVLPISDTMLDEKLESALSGKSMPGSAGLCSPEPSGLRPESS